MDKTIGQLTETVELVSDVHIDESKVHVTKMITMILQRICYFLFAISKYHAYIVAFIV